MSGSLIFRAVAHCFRTLSAVVFELVQLAFLAACSPHRRMAWAGLFAPSHTATTDPAGQFVMRFSHLLARCGPYSPSPKGESDTCVQGTYSSAILQAISCFSLFRAYIPTANRPLIPLPLTLLAQPIAFNRLYIRMRLSTNASIGNARAIQIRILPSIFPPEHSRSKPVVYRDRSAQTQEPAS